ncbi:hypothetical protein D3C75_1185350 [compost metagenome]
MTEAPISTGSANHQKKVKVSPAAPIIHAPIVEPAIEPSLPQAIAQLTPVARAVVG